MVEDMDFDSLASVVLWAIIAILFLGLQPWKTMQGMRNAMRHRADRYSTSLHILDVNDGTRFGDDYGSTGKGDAMQQAFAGASGLDETHIATVRRLRRAAIRRRRVIVVSLLVVTVFVLVLALALRFSPLFALIPLALDAVVLALGIRATKHARRWEDKVRRARAVVRVNTMRREGAVTGRANKIRREDVEAAVAAAIIEGEGGDASTNVMSQREIQETIARARRERREAFDERERRRSKAVSEAVAMTAAEVVSEPYRRRDDGDKGESVAAAVRHDGASDGSVDAAAVQVNVQEASVVAPDEYADDHTNELAQVSPAHAPDAFEMAAGQDLISFSLGAPRQGRDVRMAEPLSREIKSIKQVSHAEPVAQPERSVPSDDDDERRDFRRHHEVYADDVPDASEDSLGADVDAVLARRRG